MTTYRNIGTPLGLTYVGASGVDPTGKSAMSSIDRDKLQAKGYLGDPQFVKGINLSVGFPNSSQPTHYYYDTVADKAYQARMEMAKEQGLDDKFQAEAEYLRKQTYLLGRPKQSITGTTFSGPEPTVGELSTFNMPTRPDTPEFVMPEMGDVPEFVAPEYDEKQIAKMAQQQAAPGVRNLRTAIQAVTSRRGDNPNVDRMTLRDALAGYGQGLEEVMSGARQQASSEYAQKYAMEYKTAGMNWEQAVQTVRDKYAGAMEGRKMEYQAEMDAVNQIYSASVQAESQRVAAENQKVMSIFDAAMQKYLAGATKTTTESYQGVTFDTKGAMKFT